MVDYTAPRQTKAEFDEEDVCNLLTRYTAAQLTTFLRVMAHAPDKKIDWNAMAKNPGIGITNARECQILWRHLAYGDLLPESMEELGDQPLDDDSDFGHELEASPLFSSDLSLDAANCVKVLAFGSLNEPSMSNSSAVDCHRPIGHTSKTSSIKIHSVSLLHSSSLSASVQKQPQIAGPSGERLDGNGLGNNNFPSRRKKKIWSEEEDSELIAAVKKFGEGNWATILKGDFKGDRTPSQLSQRWAIIKKKHGNLNVGGASSQLSDVQLATRRAIDMALKDTLTGVGNGAAATKNYAKLKASNGDIPAAASNTTTYPSQLQTTQLTSTTSLKRASMATPAPRPPLKKAATKPSFHDPIQAAAVAAGGRIASPSDAASLYKAAQSKNAVHIIGGGGTSLIKPCASGSSPFPPNIHYIRGSGANTATTSMAAGTSPISPNGHQTKSGPIISKPRTTPTVAPSGSANEPKPMEDKTPTEVKVGVKPMVAVQSPLSKCLSKTFAKGLGSDPGKQRLNGADNSQGISDLSMNGRSGVALSSVAADKSVSMDV